MQQKFKFAVKQKDGYCVCKSLIFKVSFIVYGYQTTFVKEHIRKLLPPDILQYSEVNNLASFSLFEGKIELLLQHTCTCMQLGKFEY